MPGLSGAWYYTLVCDQRDLPASGKRPPLYPWSTASLQAGPPWSVHPFHPINSLWICVSSPLSSLSLFLYSVFTFTQMYQCPYCKFTNTDLNRLRMHVMTQHSVQPMLRCPLCQDMLNNKIHLQFHLTHLHSVAPDCVDKLIATVSSVFGVFCIWLDTAGVYYHVSPYFFIFIISLIFIFPGILKLASLLLGWHSLAWL